MIPWMDNTLYQLVTIGFPVKHSKSWNYDGILMDFAHLPTGAGFLPSTVYQKQFQPQNGWYAAARGLLFLFNSS
jgi:hypothetical protein